MILITGASGCIGRALAENLHADYDLRLQSRELSRLRPLAKSLEERSGKRVATVEFDFASENREEFKSLVEGCETVIHCAGVVHEPQARNQDYAIYNVRATAYLAEAAARAGVGTFLFLSTSAVYGGGPFVNATENTAFSLDTPYALSKANCEEALARVREIERLIFIRPALVFGEGDRGNMRSLLQQIERGRYFHLSGNRALKSLIYSRDLAHALSHCLDKLPSGRHIFNAANPQPVSVVELSETIAQAVGRSPLPVVPSSLLLTGATVAEKILGRRAPVTSAQVRKLMTSTTLSTEALCNATGFAPKHSLAEALRREIDWLAGKINSEARTGIGT
jgi:GlcNAc-P-P-Und epimerase